MKLLTDFSQWYDAVFDGAGPEFHRMAFTRGGLPKREQFALFERLGLRTPPHGLVRELAARHAVTQDWQLPVAAWQDEIEVVVYLDELQHAGQGKVKLPLVKALAEHPDCFASVFVPLTHPAIILRHVRFGRLGFWLHQCGGEDWRSNRADHERVLARTHHPGANPLPRLLWAIDFLPASHGLQAIDFNTAPDLVTLGETAAVTAGELRRELERAGSAAPEILRQF